MFIMTDTCQRWSEIGIVMVMVMMIGIVHRWWMIDRWAGRHGFFPSIETCFRWRRRWTGRSTGCCSCCRSRRGEWLRWWWCVIIGRRIGRLYFITLCSEHSQWIDTHHVHVLYQTSRKKRGIHSECYMISYIHSSLFVQKQSISWSNWVVRAWLRP